MNSDDAVGKEVAICFLATVALWVALANFNLHPWICGIAMGVFVATIRIQRTK